MPTPPFRVTVVRDQTYATRDGIPLQADLHLPEQRGACAPPIIWVHGGGWLYGNRRVAPDLSRFFAERGLAMVAIDYRLSKRGTFPAQIEDLKAAIRWVRAAAPAHGLDAEHIGLWGASAGGHLSALAALSPSGLFEPEASARLEQSSRVQAVAIGYAPIDFLQLDADRPAEGSVPADPENLKLPEGMRSADPDSFESLLLGAPIGTRPDRVREANPLTYVGPTAPPFLILHGRSDTTVGVHQSEILYQALAAHGTDATLCLIDGLGHGFLNRSHLDDGPSWRMTVRSHRRGGDRVDRATQPIFPMIEGFFRRHLAASGRGGRPGALRRDGAST
jgi:acetyl esterase/lipase